MQTPRQRSRGNKLDQMIGKLFHQINRAMTPTSATDRDRCVFLAFLHEPGQQQLDHLCQTTKKLSKIRVGRNVNTHIRVQAGMGP